MLRRTLVAAAVLVIGGFALSGIAQAGQIFQQWDAVVSWNRWAVDWAANRLPYATSIYPQLLPTNLSLSYVFMQSSEVWIFAKAFQFLFCLMLLLAMLDLARIEGKFGYVPGVVITYGLLVALLRFRMLSSGYADVPLAFFALASVYVLMLARSTSDRRAGAKFLMPGAVLAAGAALTKQTGLYVAAIYPVLAWRFVLAATGPWPAKASACPAADVLDCGPPGFALVSLQVFRFPGGLRQQQHGPVADRFPSGKRHAATAASRRQHGRGSDHANGRRAAADCRGGLAAGSVAAVARRDFRRAVGADLGGGLFLRLAKPGHDRSLGRLGRGHRC